MAVSPNMGLAIPSVGVTPGPAYANQVNSSLSTIDQHDHSIGNGVQITPSGLNINASLPLQGNSLTLVKDVVFSAQTSDATLGSIYMIGLDLYYTDGSGNAVRITQGGSVAGASGTITGLPSGTASASYSSGVFVFQGATNVPANIDAGSYIYRNNTVNSEGVTLQPPNALSSSYTLTLPAVPSQTNVMTLDTAGNMGSITYDAVGVAMTSTGANAIGTTMTSTGSNAIASTITNSGAVTIATTMSSNGANIIGQNMTSTGANAIAVSRTRTTGSSVGIGGVAVTSSSGSFTSGSVPFVTVTNQSLSIATSGRPVQIMFAPDGSVNLSSLIMNTSGALVISILNATTGVRVAQTAVQCNTVAAPLNVPISLAAIDFVGAGTYNYQVQMSSPNGTTQTVNYGRMMAYEL